MLSKYLLGLDLKMGPQTLVFSHKKREGANNGKEVGGPAPKMLPMFTIDGGNFFVECLYLMLIQGPSCP
jgi:hypothetical protein